MKRWMVCAALIDQKLVSIQTPEETDQRAARLRTLLPIVRGVVAAVLIVMVVLMSLSALGLEVGPLLAGAGVFGIAIGFGAQTLVRDLFSKFFYLLDDAFRVGEYIQSGNYKGTVEHLGVRSIRLRHHRGQALARVHQADAAAQLPVGAAPERDEGAAGLGQLGPPLRFLTGPARERGRDAGAGQVQQRLLRLRRQRAHGGGPISAADR